MRADRPKCFFVGASSSFVIVSLYLRIVSPPSVPAPTYFSVSPGLPFVPRTALSTALSTFPFRARPPGFTSR